MGRAEHGRPKGQQFISGEAVEVTRMLVRFNEKAGVGVYDDDGIRSVFKEASIPPIVGPGWGSIFVRFVSTRSCLHGASVRKECGKYDSTVQNPVLVRPKGRP
jgi:hypothetical protein